METAHEKVLREAANVALQAFRCLYEKLESGVEADELLEDESLWPLSQLRAAIGESKIA